MLLNLKIIDSQKQIEDKILKALLPQVQSLFNKSQKNLKNNLGILFSQAIKKSPEYNSINNGTLGYELGVPDGNSRIDQLLQYWIGSMQVKIEKPSIKSSNIKSSLSIGICRSDLADIISSDIAIIVDGRTGSRVEWLSWLSLLGDTTIVKDYDFELGPSPYSRTGGGIMRPSGGSKWSVPSQFSGTVDNNWITRSVDSVENEVYSILERSLRESL